jgi:hypothetical protein
VLVPIHNGFYEGISQQLLLSDAVL